MIRLSTAVYSTLILVAAAGCSFERGGTSAFPTSPTGGGHQASALKGRWTGSTTSGLASAGQNATTADLGRLVCSQIVWTANDPQDDGTVSGPFTAVCSNGMTLSGSATGSVNGSAATITGSGTGQLNGGAACHFSISSNGTVEGEQIRFPYVANTCLGSYSGTTFLARSALPGWGPADPAACGRSDGDSIVECVAAQHPSRLAAGVSHDTRVANMAFLRDRIIERGRCKGHDLAWNLKRGTGPHSIDALAWRINGRDEVVDVGMGYDDTSQSLQLQWIIVAGPSGYDRYTPGFTCN